MRAHIVCVVILLPLAVLAGTVEDAQYLELSAKDIRTLQITCGAGFLDVYGVDGYEHIKVTASIKISGIPPDSLPDFLDRHVLLSLHKRRDKAILQSVFKKQNRMSADAKIDLSVAIPKNLRVEIDDASGWMDVSDLDANLAIEDDSGSINVRDVRANVRIEDGSGKIQITDVRGNLEIKDGSGRIHVDRIKGNVHLVDGSGEMTIKDIEGNLTIRDGSGGIEINNVTRNVFIEEAGSGSLEIDGVKGKLNVRE